MESCIAALSEDSMKPLIHLLRLRPTRIHTLIICKGTGMCMRRPGTRGGRGWERTDLLVGTVLQDDQAVDGGQGVEGLMGPPPHLLLPLLSCFQPQVVQMLPLRLVCCLQRTANNVLRVITAQQVTPARWSCHGVLPGCTPVRCCLCTSPAA